MMTWCKSLILGCIVLLSFVIRLPAQAPEVDSVSYQSRYTLLPYIAYSPDTRLIVGGLVLHQFKTSVSDPDTRPSNLQFTGSYTLNNQLNLQILQTILYPAERIIWTGNTRFQKWPKFYWGVGMDSRENDKVRVDYLQFSLNQGVLFRIGNQLYAGPQLHIVHMYDVSFENLEENPIPPPDVTGSGGSTNAGLGGVIRWDRRDNVMTPTRHHFLEFGMHFYSTSLLSDYSYQRWLVDARKYFPLHTHDQVIAIQSRLLFTAGEVPFEQLGFIGGESIMRGYLEGRYRDKTSIQAQVEYRRTLIGRLGATVFSSIGNVAPAPGELITGQTKWTAGAGLRYNVNKNDPVNIRVDFGFNQETTGFYITLGEAF